MGTKNKPGKYDCFNKLEPDEPYFVLMGRDPLAPILIGLWAMFREEAGENEEKVEEARQCADACLKWALANGKADQVREFTSRWDKYMQEQNR